MKKKLFAILLALLLLSTTAAVFAAGEGGIQPRYATYFSNVTDYRFTGAATKTTTGTNATIRINETGGYRWKALTFTGNTIASDFSGYLSAGVASGMTYSTGHGNAGVAYRARLSNVEGYAYYGVSGMWDPG